MDNTIQYNLNEKKFNFRQVSLTKEDNNMKNEIIRKSMQKTKLFCQILNNLKHERIRIQHFIERQHGKRDTVKHLIGYRLGESKLSQ